MRAKKILLLSHLPTRDDMVDMMIARSLASKDACVWKYPILGKCRDAICLIKPDLVILPEIRIEFTQNLAMNLQTWGVRVVQRRCEMGISSETEMSDELERCLFGNIDWASYVDLDLVWGQGFADALIQHGVPEEKIRVVGGMGFDPYFYPRPRVRKEGKLKLLFAGGFGYADCSPLYAIPESKSGEKINIELVKNDRNNRDIFQGMMKEIMNRFPQYEFAVRGHPGERYPSYKNVIGEIGNMEGCITSVAIDWADVIIHPGSTMAYEAHLLNKPTFNFRNTNLDVVVGNIAPLVNTVDELAQLLEKVELNKSNANPETIKQLEKYYGIVDGKACERAVEEILKLDIKQTNIPDEWPKPTTLYNSPGTYTNIEPVTCTSCGNSFYVDRVRSMVKCPFCGIGTVVRRYLQRIDPDTGLEERISIP